MKEKSKRGSGPKISDWAKREIIGFIFLVGLVAFVIAFFKGWERLSAPPDANLTWSTDSRYLALIRDNVHFIVYDVVEQTETLQPKISNTLSARDFYDDKHLWIASNGPSGPQFLSYNVETQTIDSKISPDYTSFLPPDSQFSINPDQTSLAYLSYKTTIYNVRGQPLHKNYDILQMNLTTLKAELITRPIGEDDPQYTPDGSLVAGSSILKDGTWTQIPNLPTEKVLYSFSPDGQWVLEFEWRFASENEIGTSSGVISETRESGIYLLPVDGHAAPRLIQSWPIDEIAWSPNGCYIAYAQAYPPNFAIMLASDWGLGEFVQPGAECKPYPNKEL